MQNLADIEAEVKFEFPYGREQLRGFEVRRLRIDKKRVTAEEKRQNIVVGGDVNWTITTEKAEQGASIKLPQTITLDRFEMTVIEVEFKTGSRDLRKVQRSRHYTSSVRDSENEKADFPAGILRDRKVHYFFRDLPSTRGGVAAIRISHSRPFGTAEKPDVYINDVRLSPESFSADVAGGYKEFGDGDYFGTFLVYYNLEKLTSRKTAKVSVSYPDGGGWSTSVVVEIDQCKGSSCCVLANRKNRGPCKPSDDSGFLRPEPTPIPLE
ncbi:hypothetical protein NDN08_002142 [Rhodosorus marinus]|uniref:Uncharacterized protein n=1 Tax=Rhodosorus marinus TaxID=101924 RepID=A0AAV8UYN5_9RHOD|nr:hypothetical protein NDN08_002142 [Rhodosorus marinus]